ncbi:MAG: hypothetical protein K6A30_01080 [Lachnospiraceae bacterium]|nr:hypothetical protein [Lachnospiraceae bacterium]
MNMKDKKFWILMVISSLFILLFGGCTTSTADSGKDATDQEKKLFTAMLVDSNKQLYGVSELAAMGEKSQIYEKKNEEVASAWKREVGECFVDEAAFENFYKKLSEMDFVTRRMDARDEMEPVEVSCTKVDGDVRYLTAKIRKTDWQSNTKTLTLKWKLAEAKDGLIETVELVDDQNYLAAPTVSEAEEKLFRQLCSYPNDTVYLLPEEAQYQYQEDGDEVSEERKAAAEEYSKRLKENWKKTFGEYFESEADFEAFYEDMVLESRFWLPERMEHKDYRKIEKVEMWAGDMEEEFHHLYTRIVFRDGKDEQQKVEIDWRIFMGSDKPELIKKIEMVDDGGLYLNSK